MVFSYINIKALEQDELDTLDRISKEHEIKIKRYAPKSKIIIQLKKHNDTGSRVRYSAHCRLEAARVLLTSQADDWDFARTLHKVFQKLEKELEHKFKRSEQNKLFGKESRKKRKE